MSRSIRAPTQTGFDSGFEPEKTTMNEQELEAGMVSLIGRMAMLEVLITQMHAHFCVQFNDPVPMAAHILDAVQRNLVAAQQAAPEPERQVANEALASFKGLSDAMMAMVNRIATPKGSG